MTIAINIDSASSIRKTLQLVHQELRERVENKGFAIYDGIPTPNTVGSERRQAWIAPSRFLPDAQFDTFQTEAFMSTWLVHIIHANEAHQPEEQDFYSLYDDFGAFIESLTDTLANKDLDDAVDWTSDYTADFDSGAVEGQNRSFVVAATEVTAHHPLYPSRPIS